MDRAVMFQIWCNSKDCSEENNLKMKYMHLYCVSVWASCNWNCCSCCTWWQLFTYWNVNRNKSYTKISSTGSEKFSNARLPSWWYWLKKRYVLYFSLSFFLSNSFTMYLTVFLCEWVLCTLSLSFLSHAYTVLPLDSNRWLNLVANFMWMSMVWDVQNLWTLSCIESQQLG